MRRHDFIAKSRMMLGNAECPRNPLGMTDGTVKLGLETWGDNKVDNNARGDIKKVDNRVDNNVWDDTVNRSRIDQETIDDTVNDTVKYPQARTRTTTSYNN